MDYLRLVILGNAIQVLDHVTEHAETQTVSMWKQYRREDVHYVQPACIFNCLLPMSIVFEQVL